MSGDLTTLGAVVKATGGVLQTGPFGSQLHASDYQFTGKPLVMPVNLGDNEIREAGIARIGVEDAHRLRRHALREGDIIFSRRGDVGRRSLVRTREAGWLCGTGCLAARFGSDRTTVNPAYVADYLGGTSAQAWLVDNAVGGTMPNLNTSILSALPVWLPSKLEQDRIVAALEDVRKVIDSIQHLIAKRQAIKQGMMQHLLTGRTRLPGFNEAWSETTLGAVARFSKGAGLPKAALTSSGSTLCIHYGELFTFYGPEIRQVFSRTTPTGRVVVSEDLDVLMPTSDVTPRGLAKASAIHGAGVVLGGDILIIRPDKAHAHGPFVAHAIRHHADQVLQLVRGSTVYHLYATDMRNFALSLPSVNEQRAIAGALLDADRQLEALEERLMKARAFKTGMMQRLLTGHTRLPTEAAT
ncbi:restriction endonuclease subunit S [Nakamurella multipartita]|uniref:Restriction endonuclease S subunits-like protein n=1 Tax=Nakamurella multipartita (strain ATCC 700099 / DSM 44233 / CIP 104796 / JCM 9543 / NBRC 105858 / Y-104) TaxID=479431 RepID=C8X703_NAKMY|nr:restriction endonuclease subunit S [Nakamurella multipartita]ACV80901.1 Restriction endonuclease S subunits-like protein [Nakamurella multipartita DSM 44233]